MRGYARNHNRRLAEVARDLAEHTLDRGTVIAAPDAPAATDHNRRELLASQHAAPSTQWAGGRSSW
jgi:hypothetical protein